MGGTSRVLKFYATRVISNKPLERSALRSSLWQGTQDFWVREFTEHFKDIDRDVCVHVVEHADLKWIKADVYLQLIARREAKKKKEKVMSRHLPAT